MIVSKSGVSTTPLPSRSNAGSFEPHAPTIDSKSFTSTTPFESMSAGHATSQLVALHIEELPCQLPATAEQSACVRSKHQSAPQQAPTGWGQLAVAQEVPSPWKVPATI
jgi:hypothetical protein